MTLESIFKKIDKPKYYELSDQSHESICHITEDGEEYLTPEYREIEEYKSNARFVLFSAPGAAGKTALARHIAYKYNGIYWDLSKIRLGDNTFTGTIYEAMDVKANEFYNDLVCGRTVIVIDAFDEAQMISGKPGVNALLDDLVSKTEEGTFPTVVLLSRTDTAKEVIDYIKNKNVIYSHYEIGFINERNAKTFVLNMALKNHNNRSLIEQCINQQFAEIKRILGDDKETVDSFLGYPPVLQTLGQAYDDDNNTYKLLKKYETEKNDVGTRLVQNILESLLKRERDKVINALKQKWSSKYPDYSNFDILYTPEEQIVRMMEYMLLGSMDTYYADNHDLIGDLARDYEEVVQEFIPQSPFIINLAGKGIQFSGPAFRDYVIAYLMSHPDYKDLVDEYHDRHGWQEVPSNLLFDFYLLNGDETLEGDYFPYMYESFRASDKEGRMSTVTVYQDSEDDICIGDFLEYSNDGINDQQKSMKIQSDFTIRRISNTKIDTYGAVTIGDGSNLASITDSMIECNRIILNAQEVEIISDRGICMFCSRNDIERKSEATFILHVSDDSLYTAASNIDEFFNLRRYKFDSDDNRSKSENLIQFSKTVDKILDCMRKHRKDAPAKDKEYIDNEIIAKNESKQSILEFLLDKKILYIDSKESHLYKLDPDRLGVYGIGWQTLQMKGTEPFERLFAEYCDVGENV